METTETILANYYAFPVLEKKEQRQLKYDVKRLNKRRCKKNEDFKIEREKQIEEIEDLFKILCDFNGFKVELVKSNTRKREILIMRQISHYFAYRYINTGYAAIGLAIGNTDHVTVMHSCKNIVQNTASSYSILQVCYNKKATKKEYHTENRTFNTNDKFYVLIEHIDVYLKSIGYQLNNRIYAR